MKVQIKFPRCIQGLNYAPGVYEVPDVLADHWYLKALVSCGDVVIVDEVKEAEVKEKKKPEPKKAPAKKPDGKEAPPKDDSGKEPEKVK